MTCTASSALRTWHGCLQAAQQSVMRPRAPPRWGRPAAAQPIRHGCGLPRRDPDTQLALLDRIAGLGPAASAFQRSLQQLSATEARLHALAPLRDEAVRNELQALVEEVRRSCHVPCGPPTPSLVRQSSLL